MRVDELDYQLPPELIADRPVERRDASRLLVAPLDGAAVSHRRVRDLPGLLRPGDLLVINDTKVLPARLRGTRRGTGGGVDGLYVDSLDADRWRVMLRCGGKLVPGDVVEFDEAHAIELIEQLPDGAWIATRQSELSTEALLDLVGRMPIPPYILKRRGGAEEDALDRLRYQTIYARSAGAVAAPTAGLHFTDELFDALAAVGVSTTRLTLHVGLGTFAPVRVDDLDEHDMHTERFEVPARTLAALAAARREARRIIAVGTTSVRALESLPDELPDHDHVADTSLMIQPGCAFRWTDGLMTNFHLPRSTLLALVGAFMGMERMRDVYAEAIARRYRFYSYGDAMLLV